MNTPYKRERVPDDEWNAITRHCITPSVNLIIQNGRGEILFVLRANEPMKGALWVPGGRLLKTMDAERGIERKETVAEAAMRVAKEEVGIPEEALTLVAVSPRYQEEIFYTEDMDRASVEKLYGPDVTSVQYWGTAAYLKLTDDAVQPKVDAQSDRWQWLKDLPPDSHEYLVGYFRMMEDMGHPTLQARER